MLTQSLKLNILFAVFIAMMLGMNLLGAKITSFFGVSVSVAIFMVPVTFLITDIVAEVKGREAAQQFVYAGLVALAFIFLFTALFVTLEPHQRFQYNEAYKQVFGASLRIMIASFIAFAISQTHDVWAFHFWKEKTKGRWLWLRNNASTAVSQAIDTLLFMFIAFYQITPQFDAMFILQLALPYYIFKLVFAALDTPFVYLGVWWLKETKT